MDNQGIAKIFYEMADMLELKGDKWRPIAYRKAAFTIESLPQSLESIYKKDGIQALRELPGIGEALSQKIVEIIETGRLKKYEKLKKELPIDFENLTKIQGLGPKKLKKLYDKLNVKDIPSLKKAAEAGRIQKMAGFGLKSEKEILKGIELLGKSAGRILLGYALPIARKLVEELKECGEVEKIEFAGSLRRMKETIGDIDLLVASENPSKVMEFFVKLPDVEHVIAKGDTKSSVVLKNGFNCDLRVLGLPQYGSGLLYFTGSKEHNVELRRIAIANGLKLSEYGVFNGKKIIASKTENEMYKALKMEYIEPELRENTGEIQAALQNKLPSLIELKDLKGDTHAHTKWSDGVEIVDAMALAAKKIGLQWLCITDHSPSLFVAHGLNGIQLKKQKKEIEKAESKNGIKIFQGSECDILKDGRMDLPDATLKELDFVVASIHSHFNLDKNEMTKRVCKALENKYVTTLGHPSGRLIPRRDAIQLDWEKVFQCAKDNGKLMEVNAFPERSDLSWQNIKLARDYKIKFSIGSDSHQAQHFNFLELGVGNARRGWLEKKDVVNCLSAKELQKFLGK